MHTFCIAVVGDAFDARDARFEPVGTHVGAHKIKRTPNFGVRTHCSYVQPAMFAFAINLISRSLHVLVHARIACRLQCRKCARAFELRIVRQGFCALSGVCAPL